jgi:sugar-phosphatase
MFDMDGVLVDSEPAHLAVTRGVLADCGLPVPDIVAWERVFFGRPDRDGLLDWCLEHHLTTNVEAVMAEKVRRFEAVFPEAVTPFEDGQWLARALHSAGLPLALVTGARRREADLVLDRFGLRDLFVTSISADETSTGKPDPGPYLAGSAALGVCARECVVVEDSVPGLRAAEAAGATPIVVDRLDQPGRYVTVQPVNRLDERVLGHILALWRR